MARKPQSRKTAKKRGGLRRRKTISKRAVRGGHPVLGYDVDRTPFFITKQNKKVYLGELVEIEYNQHIKDTLNKVLNKITFGSVEKAFKDNAKSKNNYLYFVFKIRDDGVTFMSLPDYGFKDDGIKYPWVYILNLKLDDIKKYNIKKIGINMNMKSQPDTILRFYSNRMPIDKNKEVYSTYLKIADDDPNNVDEPDHDWDFYYKISNSYIDDQNEINKEIEELITNYKNKKSAINKPTRTEDSSDDSSVPP